MVVQDAAVEIVSTHPTAAFLQRSGLSERRSVFPLTAFEPTLGLRERPELSALKAVRATVSPDGMLNHESDSAQIRAAGIKAAHLPRTVSLIERFHKLLDGGVGIERREADRITRRSADHFPAGERILLIEILIDHCPDILRLVVDDDSHAEPVVETRDDLHLRALNRIDEDDHVILQRLLSGSIPGRRHHFRAGGRSSGVPARDRHSLCESCGRAAQNRAQRSDDHQNLPTLFHFLSPVLSTTLILSVTRFHQRLKLYSRKSRS